MKERQRYQGMTEEEKDGWKQTERERVHNRKPGKGWECSSAVEHRHSIYKP
jgi:hypothetical protein